jgi:hypothetical protein
MARNKRRELLQAAAALATGGAATTVRAAESAPPRVPFAVAQTYIPIAGTDELFPVRRIYCIGVSVGYGWSTVSPGGTSWMASVGFWKTENVGPVIRGDVMDALVDGRPDIRVRVV